MLTNRLLIYSINEGCSNIDDYIIYMLEHLCTYCNEVIITYTGELEESNRELLKKYSENIINIEHNNGYAKGYITALLYYGLHNLKKFDNILLVNSNIAGPVNSFDELFFIMDRENVDFWGIVKNHHKNIVNNIQQTEEYIDTYFVNITKSMFDTDVFRQFIIGLDSNDYIINDNNRFSHYFTQYFETAGFKCSVFLNDEKIKEYAPNPLVYAPVKLIKEYNCPVISLELFKTDYRQYLDYTNGEAAYELINYITNETSYNIDMVIEYIIRTNNQYDIKNIIQLNYILPSEYTNSNIQNITKPKTALMLHMYFEDLFEETLGYAKNMPDYADIYISTQTEEKKAKIEALVKNFKNKVKVMVIKNRGRDVSALTVAFREYIYNYDIVCFAHDKKASHLDYGIKGAGYEYICYENTLLSKAYIENVINLFTEDKKIGILAPPVPQFSNFYLVLSADNNGWGDNYQICCDLAKKLNLHVDIDINKAPVAPFGSIFWFRVDALKPLFDLQLDYDDFPEEPLGIDGTISHGIERIHPFIAQSRGYYCGHIYSDKFAKMHLTNLQYMLTAVNKKVFTLTPPDLFNNSLQHLSEFKNIYDNLCKNYNETIDKLNALQEDINNKYTIISNNHNEILYLRSEVERLNFELGCIYNSKSWNITKSLRFIQQKIKKLFFKIKNIGNKPVITEESIHTDIADENQSVEKTITDEYVDNEIYNTINNSELFDKEWYKKEYGLGKSVDPVLHYITEGANLGYKTSEKFDTAKYVEINHDIKGLINPLYHWLTHGIAEHRVDITVGVQEIYPDGYMDKPDAKNILLVTHRLNHTGAPILLLETGKILKKYGYNVYVVSPVSGSLENQFILCDIPVFIDYKIITDSIDSKYYINFDLAIVNTIECGIAYKILSSKIKTLWWIHENITDEFLGQNSKIREILMNADNVYTGSKITQQYLLKYNSNVRILKYILDYKDHECNYNTGSIIKFAVVGTVCKRKGQDLFIKAIKMLEENIRAHAIFYILGDTSIEKEFVEQIKQEASGINEIKFIETIHSKSEYQDFIHNLDVICCPSRADSFPLVIIDGMMYGKVCIISDEVGQVELIKNQENGMIFSNENIIELYKSIKYLIENREVIDLIKENAYKSILSYLNADENLKILQDIIEQ